MDDEVNFSIKTPLQREVSYFFLWCIVIAAISWYWVYPRVLFLMAGLHPIGILMDLAIVGTILSVCIFLALRNFFSRDVITVTKEKIRIRSGVFAQDAEFHWSQIVGFEQSVSAPANITSRVLRIKIANDMNNTLLCAKDKPVATVHDVWEGELPERADRIAERLTAYQKKHICVD